jgi:hypothetical protein
MINRVPPTPVTDTWLTPLNIINALGPFDLDPCCPEIMPWATADIMLNPKIDGLKTAWEGYVWCNPPFSKILPWATKMAEHNNGILLVPAKSTDSKWGQYVLENCTAVLFQKGRIAFNYPDGTPSTGKWSPYMFAAFGLHASNKLAAAVALGNLEGVML